MDKYKEVERSIIKKFRKEIYRPFVKALDKYNLINEGDKIMVCISGGKDSFLLAKLIEEIKVHGNKNFEYKCVCMNPGYNKEVVNKIKENAKILNIDLKFFKTDIFSVASSLDDKPCYMCARMRRGHLYNEAKKLGCNKIALGHHFDDVIETDLINLFFASQIRTMLPLVSSKNFEGVKLIRPMYMIREKDIVAWKNYNNLDFIGCACPLSNSKNVGKRDEIKEFVKDLEKNFPTSALSIFKAYEKVNLDDIVSYVDNGIIKSNIDEN